MFLSALLLSLSPAFAATKNVTGYMNVDPGSIPVNTATRLTGGMCNLGTSYVGGTAFLGTYIPTGLAYTLVAPPSGGVCRATRSGAYNYIQCTVSLDPGMCGEVQIDVTPRAVGDVTLYVSADSANVLRETNELDNRASVVLTAY